MQGNHKTKKMKSPITLSGKELARLSDTGEYIRTRTITYSDPGIMRDSVSFKISNCGEVRGTTRGVLLVGGALAVVGTSVYAVSRAIKRENDIKTFNAKKQAELDLYIAKKKADRLYGRFDSETDDNPSEIHSDDYFSEPKPLDDMVEEALSDPVARRQTEPLIKDFVDCGDLAIIYSGPGTGKTIVSYQMGCCIAEGKTIEFIDGATPIKQCVYYYDSELDKSDVVKRYGKQQLPHDFKFCRVQKRIPPKALLKNMRKCCDEQQSDFTIFVDNITTMFGNMTSEELANTVIDGILELQQEMMEERGLLLTVILVAHTTKGGDLRGTGLWSVGVKDIFLLEKVKDVKNLFTLKSEKCRNGEGGEILLEIENSPLRFVRAKGTSVAKAKCDIHPSQQPALTPDEKERVKVLYKSGWTYERLAEEFPVSTTTIHKIIHEGKKGKDKRGKKGSKKH